MAGLCLADDDHTLYLSQGSTIFLQNDRAEHWFRIKTGSVRLIHLYPDGHRHVLGFLFPGDVLGIEKGMYRSTAEAITDVTLEKKRKSAFICGEENRDEDRAAFIRALEIADDSLHVLGRKTAIERMAAFLIRLSRRQGRSDEIKLPMSRSDIADHLGVTLETASRSLCDLARRDLLSFKTPRVIRVLDHAALLRLGGLDGEERTDLASVLG